MKKFSRVFFSLFCIVMMVLLQNCSNEKPDQPAWTPEQPLAKATPPLKYSIVNKYPHDIESFTEGLLFHEGQLYESTGATDNLPQTRSLFGVVDIKTGKIDVKAELDRKTYFGEGITFLNGKAYQLTYRTHIGFVYDAKNFKKIDQFSYPNEGWGMTTDGKSLIYSDGTFTLTYLDPVTLQVQKTLVVTKDGFGVDSVNELEWINGYIYANIWMTSRIIKIDPATGVVVAEGDFSSLQQEASKDNPKLLEMNGIAFNPESGNILVTGKLWPWLYELKLQ